MIQLLLMIGLTFGVVVLAARQGPFAMRGAVLIMMMFVAFFAPKLTAFPGLWISNYGNVWYAATLVLQALISRRIGWRLAMATAGMTFYWLVVIAAMLVLISLAPVVMPGESADSATSSAISIISANMLNVAIYSWTGFLAATGAVVALVHMLRNVMTKSAAHRYVLMVGVVWIGQLIDSLIFFPGVFYRLPNLTQIMLVGLFWKCALSVLYCTVTFVPLPVGQERRDQLERDAPASPI